MHPSYILQLNIPLRQLLGREIKPALPVRNIVVLAKHASQVATREEDAAAAVVALQARLLAKVRRDGVDGYVGGGDQACARRFVAVHAAKARAEVAVAEVGVGGTALEGCVAGREGEVAGGVVVEEEGWGEVEMAASGREAGGQDWVGA